MQEGLGLCSGHSPAFPACSPDSILAVLPSPTQNMSKWRRGSCRRQRGATTLTVATAGPCWPLGPESFALFSGRIQGNTSVVFTVGDGWAFSVPVQALIQLQLLKPFSRCPVEDWPYSWMKYVGVFAGRVCNCWTSGTGWL